MNWAVRVKVTTAVPGVTDKLVVVVATFEYGPRLPTESTARTR